MPYIHVTSNVTSSSLTVAETTSALSQRFAQDMGKSSEKLLMAQLSLDTPLSFNGTQEPAAFVYVRSIERFDSEANQTTSAAVCATVSELLRVPSDRIFINFIQIPATHWGFNSTTVATLLA